MKDQFEDRKEAGQLLAQRLERFTNCPDVIVIGLPRGGVPVAYEVAIKLHSPLDVFIVRKLGVPGQPEFAMGAIASGGVRVMNDSVVRYLGISEEAIANVVSSELTELHRRELAYRGESEVVSLNGKTVILIDDGIATGATMLAAVQAVKKLHASKLIVAVPVADGSAAKEIASHVDEFVVLQTPDEFNAVGQWYVDFPQTSDDEVRALMADVRVQLGSCYPRFSHE